MERSGRIRPGYRCQKSLSVRMGRIGKNLLCWCKLYQVAEVHYTNHLAYVLHALQIMRDIEVGKVETLLQIPQQVQNLGPDGHIKRRNRFIQHYQVRVQGQGACNGDPLSLSTTELMRIVRQICSGQSNHLKQLLNTRC